MNVSPSALSSAELDGCLPEDLSEVVVETTEHEQIGDEEGLQHALDPLRGPGVTVAIDDAGAGYASLRQVMLLHAELVKLDRALAAEQRRSVVGRGQTGFSQMPSTSSHSR